ncbi:hypothetical protein CLG85_006595 [Yangia mangrovi]|uniref:Uncharacterized protein n=2 Tax=Alloyangia mangrovi TaxID=1779329 RepID=A0A2A3JRN8_9RHOB|nr:hypothetical protein [Alloyangia mangrovi]
MALALSALLFLAPAARAAEIDAPLQAVIAQYVQPFLEDAALIAAIKAQNDVTSRYDDARINELDAMWQAEIGATEIPTITPVWDNPVADALRAEVASSGGLIREILVMDARGLNVAVSSVTSDYWQGDEAKYLETYARGPDAVHIGDVEFDESSQVYMQQLSLSIADPQSGAVIGALTVGLDAERLQ